jgi:membrane protease YdiL (CAAX protease family)
VSPTALALLILVVGVLLWRAIARERRDYGRFKRLRSTIARQKVYRRWLIEAVVSLGGLSLVTLVGAWSSIPTVLAAAQAWPPIAAVRSFLGEPYGPAVAVGVAVLLVAALVVPVLLIREPLDETPAIGDIRALLPRTRGELPYGAGLSLNAGIFEELLFRLGLPALAFAVTGDAVIAFVGATVLFGVLHIYQGLPGVVLSSILGVVFAFLYLVTGSILVPIALHAALDLRSMVLIPIALGGVLKSRAPATTVAP